MEILAGLNTSAVTQLEDSWKIPDKYLGMFSELEKLMSSTKNYQNYRNELSNLRDNKKSRDLVVVPYLGVYLRDLTFIGIFFTIFHWNLEENSDQLSSGFMNFEKMCLLGKVLIEMHSYQSQNLIFEEDLLIHNALSNLVMVDGEALYQFARGNDITL